ncbi:MAG: glutamine-hydrolyzing carbamoyl-phosphate synthase small subunit [Chloroflexi bacterium]|nr:glutamine-hydrolyzing carbamoyl-phosphate synthase small subunit [Chloroflexota bacterium]
MEIDTAQKAILVLEDGSLYRGYAFGGQGIAYGEVVFNTSMTGYQEMLTDPSYAGQILVLTYPLIGNYGINAADVESRRIQVSGLVVREVCSQPSHWQSQKTLADYLAAQGVPGIWGVDTRALTRRLRTAGVMMGMITTESEEDLAWKRLQTLPRYDATDFVAGVTTEGPYKWEGPETTGHHILVVDSGVKYNIMRIFHGLGCRVTVVPSTMVADDMLKLEPEGIVLSPGPGDPALLGYLSDTVKELLGRVPIMGICLGHQMVARALGASTFKLKFGHRGANHPVRDLVTGRVYITAQNHGYAVAAEGLPSGLEVSHLHLNDGTVEGLRHRELPILTIQYHSEASPGPQDNVYLFDRFLEMVRQ